MTAMAAQSGWSYADSDWLPVFPGPRAPYAGTGSTGPLAQVVIEVLSEFTETRDRGIKRECYARYGVPEYWIVDPFRARIEVYRLQEDADQPEMVADLLRWQPVEGGPVLVLDVGELLADLEYGPRAQDEGPDNLPSWWIKYNVTL